MIAAPLILARVQKAWPTTRELGLLVLHGNTKLLAVQATVLDVQLLVTFTTARALPEARSAAIATLTATVRARETCQRTFHAVADFEIGCPPAGSNRQPSD